MDNKTFDSLLKLSATSTGRRRLFQAAAAVGVGGLLTRAVANALATGPAGAGTRPTSSVIRSPAGVRVGSAAVASRAPAAIRTATAARATSATGTGHSA
jgi:hypothetical protein